MINFGLWATDLFFGHGIKFGIGAAILVGLFTWDHGRIKRHRADEARKIVHASGKKASSNAANSRKGHSAASKRSNFDRLFDKYSQ